MRVIREAERKPGNRLNKWYIKKFYSIGIWQSKISISSLQNHSKKRKKNREKTLSLMKVEDIWNSNHHKNRWESCQIVDQRGVWEETAEKIPTQGCICREIHQGTFLPMERKSLKGQREILVYNSSSGAHKLVERDSPNKIWFQEAEKPYS